MSVSFLHPNYDPDAVAQRRAAENYRVVEFDAGRWVDLEAMHDDIARGFDFPSYYGRNPDAFWDCINDVESYAENTRQAGLFVLIRNYDPFAAAHPREAYLLLEMLDRASPSRQSEHEFTLECEVLSTDWRPR